jgi:hypothetical protein
LTGKEFLKVTLPSEVSVHPQVPHGISNIRHAGRRAARRRSSHSSNDGQPIFENACNAHRYLWLAELLRPFWPSIFSI